jgi:hypothetical protein
MGGKVRKWGLLSIQQQHIYILLAANCNIQMLRRRKPNLGVGPPAMTPQLRHYSIQFYQRQKVKKGHQMCHGAAILHKLAMTVVIKSAIHHSQYLTTLIVFN